MSVTGFGGILDTLRQPNFGRYVLGNTVSLVGTWMRRIAVGWLTWELTASPTWLGIIAMTELFPAVFLGPLGGALADRFDRVRILIVAQSVAGILALTFFILSIAGVLTIWPLASLTLTSGIAIGLSQASRLALAPSLVPRSHLTTAIAINSMTFNAARFVGPVFAGALVTYWRLDVAFLINALSFLALIVALMSLRLAEQDGMAAAGRGSILADIGDAISFTARHAAIGPMLLMAFVATLCVRPMFELLPGLADTVFGRGADGFAGLVACVGAGAVAGGLWMAQRGGRAEVPARALLGTLLAVAANLAIIVSPTFAVALIFAGVAGAAMVISGIGTQTVLQFSVASHMRGRVLSLYGVIFIGGPAIGALVIGSIAEVAGLRPPLAAAAVIAGLVWVWAWSRRAAIVAALMARDGE